MDRQHLENLDQPLYLCHGVNPYGLELYFASEGDYFAEKDVIDAVRSELDRCGLPVVEIVRSNQPYTDQDVSCFSFNTTGRSVPEALLNEIRHALNVRCWGAGYACYGYDQNLKPTVLIRIQEGRIAPNHNELARIDIRVSRVGDELSFPAYDDIHDTEVGIVAELLGIFLQGGVSSLGTDEPDIIHVPKDYSMSEAELFDALAASQKDLTHEVPDNVAAFKQLWDGPAPPETA